MKLLARADALRIPLRAESVQCVVTSPPYWGLRCYGVDGQLGLEETPEEYVAKMVEVFREVRRVLRLDGTLWLNLGDCYAGSWSGNSMRPEGGTQRPGAGPGFQPLDERVPSRSGACGFGTKPKDLMGMPWRVAFALQADGWWLRSDIVWNKPNPMPESITDRPTRAHEYVFLLSKSARYFCDMEAVREPAVAGNHFRNQQDSTRYDGRPPGSRPHTQLYKTAGREAGRNLRTVWTIATQPYPGAHFATFPEKLVEPCILAGTSAKGCCPECGAPWERVVESKPDHSRGEGLTPKDNRHPDDRSRYRTNPPSAVHTTTGWRPTCDHDHDPVPCTVLDPFVGSGTTVRVANRHRRRAIGLDLSAAYLHEQAKRRTFHVQGQFA